MALEDVPDGEHLRRAELLQSLAVVRRATHVLAKQASDAHRIDGWPEDLARVERWIAAHVPTQSVSP